MDTFSKAFEGVLITISGWLIYVALTAGPLWLLVVAICTGVLSTATLLHLVTGKRNFLSKRPSWRRGSEYNG